MHWERRQGLRGCILESSLSSAAALPLDLLVSQKLSLSWPLNLPIRGQEPTCSEHQCVCLAGAESSLDLCNHPSDLGAMLGFSPITDEVSDSEEWGRMQAS